MADYFALLSRAVAALEPNTEDARGHLYDRARVALVDSLRAADPPWSEDQIDIELASLDSAAGQIEFEIAQAAGGARRRQAKIRPQPPHAVGDAASRRRRESSVRSTALVGVLGAVVLALIAAGSFAYLSQPGPKRPAAKVNTAGGADKPEPSRQATAKPNAEPVKSPDAQSATLPYGMARQFVFYRSSYSPGTIIIDKPQRSLYLVKAETVAIKYSIGIGPACRDAAGLHLVAGKQEWPQWPPAPAGSKPQVASAGPGQHPAESRLGARALFLSALDYGIHGTDKPSAIGQSSPFGCFVLLDDDVTDLYDRAALDAHVVIVN
jgi:lipoprotein-anchoring transpeptidase ErfK/SrfK